MSKKQLLLIIAATLFCVIIAFCIYSTLSILIKNDGLAGIIAATFY